MIFLICDTHLGHENIKRYCDRPDNFERLIETNWQQTVTDADTVIHLGDIALNRKTGDALVAKLGGWKGRKILVRGNHDKQSDDFYMSHGFTLIVNTMTLRVDDVKFLFSHRPIFNHDCDINIHGHQHNLSVLDDTRLYLPLSIEHMGYKPIAFDAEFVTAIKNFVVRRKQPTLNELMQLRQNAIGKPYDRDFYDGFGREIFNRSRERLKDCYALINSPPYVNLMQRYRLWWFALRYIEDKISKREFLTVCRSFLEHN